MPAVKTYNEYIMTLPNMLFFFFFKDGIYMFYFTITGLDLSSVDLKDFTTNNIVLYISIGTCYRKLNALYFGSSGCRYPLVCGLRKQFVLVFFC